jgi:hypothetical protein
VAGAALDDLESRLDVESPLDLGSLDLESPLDFEADEASLEDSAEALDFFVSPFDELLPDPARLSVR